MTHVNESGLDKLVGKPSSTRITISIHISTAEADLHDAAVEVARAVIDDILEDMTEEYERCGIQFGYNTSYVVI